VGGMDYGVKADNQKYRELGWTNVRPDNCVAGKVFIRKSIKILQKAIEISYYFIHGALASSSLAKLFLRIL
jgi:hypothetical protein